MHVKASLMQCLALADHGLLQFHGPCVHKHLHIVEGSQKRSHSCRQAKRTTRSDKSTPSNSKVHLGSDSITLDQQDYAGFVNTG